MTEPETWTIDVNGFGTRVWRAGSGPKLGFLAGFGGLPRWVPFLDELAKSRTVIVPSLPGFPGGERGLIEASTLLIWGKEDRIMPRSNADRFAATITGPTRIVEIAGAGHLAELDKPAEVAAAVTNWIGD